jgi:hypothetical protein
MKNLVFRQPPLCGGASTNPMRLEIEILMCLCARHRGRNDAEFLVAGAVEPFSP